MANLNIKTKLTGGTVDCVDRNTDGMKVNGSLCFATISGTPNITYIYRFDASSTATQDGLVVIIPYGQSAGTAGRWLLHGTMIGTLKAEELGYLSGVTSNIQEQLNGKASTSNPSIAGSITLSTKGGWTRFKDESSERDWDLHMHNGWLTIYSPTTGEHLGHTRLDQFPAMMEFGFGFQQLPNGLIFQWVLGPVVTGEYAVTVNLPTTYPHINLATVVSTHLAGRDAMFQTSDWQRASVTVFCNSMDSSGGSLQPLIFSIGY